jgi:serine protease Do
VQLPDNQQGWIAGQPPYASLTGDCAIIPQGSIPPAPIGGGGGSGGGNGCILFQNHFNDEATVTLTGKDGRYNQTFTVGRKANDRHCVAPGGYTYTIDVPPPWGSINGELDIQRGRTITFPIYGN